MPKSLSGVGLLCGSCLLVLEKCYSQENFVCVDPRLSTAVLGPALLLIK